MFHSSQTSCVVFTTLYHTTLCFYLCFLLALVLPWQYEMKHFTFKWHTIFFWKCKHLSVHHILYALLPLLPLPPHPSPHPLLWHWVLWLHVDLWYCAMWNLRPHFWSTVLELEHERRAWQGGNRKMNYRLLKLIWKPGYVLIQRWTVVGAAARRRRVVQHSGFLLVHINCAGAALTLICAAGFSIWASKSTIY